MVMNCEQWQDKIDPFVDAELPVPMEQEFRDHLRACPACAAETVARQQLKAHTHTAGKRYVGSYALQQKVLRMTGRKKRPVWQWAAGFSALAAAALLFVFFTVHSRQNLLEQQSLVQIVDEHVAVLTTPSWISDQTADPQALKSWLGTKVPFSVDAPQLKNTPYSLIGGRVTFIQRTPAAHLVFAAHHHQLSVFIFQDGPATSGLGNTTTTVRRMGFETESWTEDGLRYFAISDGSAQDVKDLCDLLKKADES